ncbi:MAG: NIF family HAD-type phosphatase [Candidatus Bathyarchaeia archaeon]
MANSIAGEGKIRAVALDFDGVVTRLEVDWKAAIQQASRVAGREVKSLLAFYESFHSTPLFQLVSREMEKLELKALEKAKPMPFLKEFLEKASSSNVEVFLVSMQSTAVVDCFLRRHDLSRFFKEVLTRDAFPSKKAEVEHILNCLRLKPEEVLLVDDLERNIVRCGELGIRCFHFKPQQDRDALKEMWLTLAKLVCGESCC